MSETMKSSGNKVTDVDPESFRHVVTCVKSIAVVRPQHIIQFDYASFNKQYELNVNLTDFVCELVKIFTSFVNQRPDNPHVVSVDRPGLFFFRRPVSESDAFLDSYLLSIPCF